MMETGETTLSEIYAKKGKDYETEFKKQKLLDMKLEKWEADQRANMELPVKEKNE